MAGKYPSFVENIFRVLVYIEDGTGILKPRKSILYTFLPVVIIFLSE